MPVLLRGNLSPSQERAQPEFFLPAFLSVVHFYLPGRFHQIEFIVDKFPGGRIASKVYSAPEKFVTLSHDFPYIDRQPQGIAYAFPISLVCYGVSEDYYHEVEVKLEAERSIKKLNAVKSRD